jgi:hypothetical protein
LLIVLRCQSGEKEGQWLFLTGINTESQVEFKKDEKLRRIKRTSLLFNGREQEAINLYCEKYKIQNRSKFMREAIMTEVLKRFDEDYPTLFEFEKPNLFYSR